MTYGGKFKIFIVDMWKHHCRWPVNRFGDSYNFMVKHPWIWRLQFRSSGALVHDWVSNCAVVGLHSYPTVSLCLVPPLV